MAQPTARTVVVGVCGHCNNLWPQCTCGRPWVALEREQQLQQATEQKETQ